MGRPTFFMSWLVALAAVAVAAGLPTDTTHVLELPDDWHYAPAPDPPDVETLPETWQRVSLPHRQGTEPCGLYRLRFAVPAAWARHRVSLVVRAASGVVRAWVNGQAAGVRPHTALDVRLDVSAAVQPGVPNTLLVTVSDTGSLGRGGLAACWLEATGAVAVDRLTTSSWCLAGGALVDVNVAVGNHTLERFEGRVELALEPAAPTRDEHPVWHRRTDVRLDPGQSASIYHAYEIEQPRCWRFDDPHLYRLTCTVRTREGQVVHTTVRRLGLRSVEVVHGRWHVNREWVRLAGVSFGVPGATLLCPLAGQATSVASRLAPGREAALPALLDVCDEQGIVVLLDAPAHSDAVPGWREALGELAAAAAWHPCVWGWVAEGETEARGAALAHLRRLTPRLPVGCLAPDFADDAKAFDFVVSRYTTRAVRHDNDSYWRRLEDLTRDFAGKPVVCLDRLQPVEPGTRKGIGRSLPRRRDEAARRWPIAMLFFELDRDEQLYRIVEDKLRCTWLKPPSHEARPDKDAFVVKTRFEGNIASPVVANIPCVSLDGYRVVWRAGRGSTEIATGTIPVSTIRARTLERHPPERIRGEFEWRADRPGSLEFALELHSPSGRVVAAHRRRLTLQKTRDGKVALKVGPPEVEKPAPPPPPKPLVLPDALVALDLGKLLNNDGISPEANKTDGNFDLPKLKSGSSYPADQLPKGGSLFRPAVLGGILFRFPPAADGRPNNVACDGQRLGVPKGVYATLWLLAAAEFGNQEGAARLVYDKGEEPAALRVSDWCGEAAFGEAEAIRCTARHTWDGKREDKACRIWAVAIPLRDQPLQAIVLPKNPHIHVFAATLVRATETLAVHFGLPFDNDGISWRSSPADGNFDLPGRRTGDSFIADLLPKSDSPVPVPGNPAITFRFPNKDDRRRNNAVCDGQRLIVPEPPKGEPAPRYDAAWLLGACHDGAAIATLDIEYEDGKAQGEVRLSDWCARPAAGEIDVLRMPARHTFAGEEQQIDCGLVAWRVPLDPKRTLIAITLPRERRMHVFALTLSRTKVKER